MHNRLSIMEKLPGPGLLGGIVPAASPGSIGMLRDYIRPEERLVACPNQDVVYGFGVIDGMRGPPATMYLSRLPGRTLPPA